MKTLKLIIPVAALLLFAGQAAAQSGAEQEAAAAVREAEAREDEVARKLQEAERKMAEAARQIAELTMERLPELREMEHRIEIINDDRPRLGVNIGEDKSSGPVEGVRILGVTPGSAADDAGLRTGDIITAINGETLSADEPREATRRIMDFMAGVEQGDVLDVEYLRDGKVGSVEIEPRAVEMRAHEFRGFPRDFSMPSMPEMGLTPEMAEKFRHKFLHSWSGNAWSDMELVELNEGLGKYFGADSGVLVVSAPESDTLQLEDGDVIQKIDGREPTSVRHAMRILSSYQAGESLEIEILRDKKKRTLEIEIPDERSSMLLDVPAPMRPTAAPRPAAAPAHAPRREKT
ncbi:MAG: PDZ domain-containing protein [Gammaproteobacteria bacterium]|nr:PDZ domain-containing protein [Gammaproteobacteria bacterium]MDH3374007.1 PDZ domain-containing protein [Gammaproteobacteria bacterium]MDH3409900.1 PDZ domain-containing protein [Gammaproteobacteria bacterium]MDH3552294.1 PDZ domain-containing protein [Gammaproteobacteria bacterium]